MPRCLLIETATEVCSVAVSADGEVLASAETPAANQHTSMLAVLIRDAMHTAGLALRELDAVGISRGPGSYTSLRVGAATAKGICYASGLPLIAVDTLQSLALAAADRTPEPEQSVFLPMLDARRQEVWTALYDHRGNELLPAQALVLGNGMFEKFAGDWNERYNPANAVLSGNGAFKAKNIPFFEYSAFWGDLRCSAMHLHKIVELKFQNAEFQNVAYYEPFYMKNPNITTPTRQFIF